MCALCLCPSNVLPLLLSSQVYHLPINEAADSLGIGVTVLKKYCRKFCIPRWPYRKLKSMDKLIESLQAYQATGLDTDDEAQVGDNARGRA